MADPKPKLNKLLQVQSPGAVTYVDLAQVFMLTVSDVPRTSPKACQIKLYFSGSENVMQYETDAAHATHVADTWHAINGS